MSGFPITRSPDHPITRDDPIARAARNPITERHSLFIPAQPVAMLVTDHIALEGF